jgi:hypothetical protein
VVIGKISVAEFSFEKRATVGVPEGFVDFPMSGTKIN